MTQPLPELLLRIGRASSQGAGAPRYGSCHRYINPILSRPVCCWVAWLGRCEPAGPPPRNGEGWGGATRRQGSEDSGPTIRFRSHRFSAQPICFLSSDLCLLNCPLPASPMNGGGVPASCPCIVGT
jgi:hypothetical protein